MASQIDKTRVYTSLDEETDTHLRKCPLCQVKGVPRGITNTGKHDLEGQKVHCPNCGHTYTWNSLIDGRVEGVDLRSEGGATSITTDGGTLQLYADIAPYYADDTSVTWSSSDEAVATVDSNGLVTAVANGTAVITATSNSDNTHFDEMAITVSNQV